MGRKRKRVAVDGNGPELSSHPFASLESSGLSGGASAAARTPSVGKAPGGKRSRGRVDVLRQRSAGGSGWMTVAKHFAGISDEEKKSLKKEIQKRCGAGGSIKAGNIEIQGDQRDDVKRVLEAAGFRVVFSGG